MALLRKELEWDVGREGVVMESSGSGEERCQGVCM